MLYIYNRDIYILQIPLPYSFNSIISLNFNKVYYIYSHYYVLKSLHYNNRLDVRLLLLYCTTCSCPLSAGCCVREWCSTWCWWWCSVSLQRHGGSFYSSVMVSVPYYWNINFSNENLYECAKSVKRWTLLRSNYCVLARIVCIYQY